MAMDFEQRAAGAVAKAELRAKPGRKKGVGIKGTNGRGKNSSVENPTSIRNGAAEETEERRERGST
jgi:hypothetical protein